jgi:preprotein translocase subunit YajC
MVSFYYVCWMLAVQIRPGGSESGEPVVQQAADGQGGGGLFDSLGLFLPAMLIVMVVYFLLMLPRQQQKEQAKISEMLNNLKKNDEVLTVGGIRGTIVNLREDGDYLTIRIDENTNTKMRILRKSVIRVLQNEDKDKSE